MDTLADAMVKLEIASKRLATSTAYLISITAKTTTLNYTDMRTESKDDTINNTHRSTATDYEATTCKNDTKVATQTPKIEKVTTQNTTTVKVTTPVTINESKDHTDNTKTDHTKTTKEVVNETSSCFTDIKSPLKSSPVITSLAPVSSTQMIKCLSPVEMKQILIKNFCFKNLFNYFAGHRCKQHTIVFLQTELEPPWKPHDTRYNAMSLEDKTRF
nr:hypothetical protein [Tanacetum cinerariifolium]